MTPPDRPMHASGPDVLRMIPLGGLGEIGRNMMVYEYEGQAIAVDVGLMFPEEEMLGVDLVIPDFEYVRGDPSRLQAVFLTHGHEDHIGALPFLLREVNVPVFCTRLTRGLVEVKLREHKLLDKAHVQVVEPGQTVNIGPFAVEFFAVAHSIPDAAGLIIHTPIGPVVHTGDFKLDHTPVMGQHTDLNRLAEIGREGVLLLAADSTYAEVEGYTPSEQTVADALERVIADAEGRVIVATFASLISRVQMVLDSAERHDRRVFVTGRSMVNNVRMARDLGYLQAGDNVLMNPREMRDHPDRKTIVISTGAQGEPTAALTRMANGTHQHVSIQEGDTVVLSSSPIPGNEALVYRNIDNLFRAGAKVIYNRIAPVHVRGHAAREELKVVHSIVQPQYFVGIHGEHRHLVLHRELAIELGAHEDDAFVLSDGDVLEITADEAAVVDRIPADYVYVDGLGVGEIDRIVLRDRQSLASDGMVVVVVAIDRQQGRLSGTPQVMTQGFVSPDDEAEMIDGVRRLIVESFGGEGRQLDWTGMRERLKDEVASHLYRKTHRQPLVLPVTVEV
ncbi:MAG: ribonuclease J [Chloroflexi bacterium]|nr:ribonuclease J [Chloroflexota bacterium]